MSRRRRRKRSHEASTSRGSIYPTLDLHGRTADEAEWEAEGWLRDRRGDGESMVRLVTGRGLHSVGPPILPATIEELLRRLGGSVVEGFEREPGGGAYRVRLTRGGVRPASLPRPVNSAAPPDVLREAAEALAELGVAPTPALLEAEIRRIIKKRSGEAQ
jgi:Smr domain